MANGGSYSLVSERPFVSGSGRYLQLAPAAAHGPLALRLNGSEICRRHSKPVLSKFNKGDDLLGKVNAVRKSKRKGGDISEARNLQTLQSTESGYASFSREVSTQSVASPASEMEMVAEEDMEADENDELNVYRGLVLDMTYRPVNVVNWKRALCLDILEKADVLEYYDQVIYSPNRAFFIPAVLKICNFVHAPNQKMVKLTLNRSNVFLRDKFRCQYCNARENLTIDHVKAASRGGGWSWDNLVTACGKCNLKKADKTLEEARMKLMSQPREPKALNSTILPPNYKTFRSLTLNKYTPAEWRAYLPRNYPSFK